MNYEEMSDLQINLLVADAIGVDAAENSGVVYGAVKHGGDNVVSVIGVVDYCNNPSDAWPIISESKINLVSPIETRNSWTASHTKGGGNWNLNDASVVHENPLRAAMIVFLMMQEKAK